MENVYSVDFAYYHHDISSASPLHSLSHEMNVLYNKIGYRRIEYNRWKDGIEKRDVYLIYVPTNMEAWTLEYIYRYLLVYRPFILVKENMDHNVYGCITILERLVGNIG